MIYTKEDGFRRSYEGVKNVKRTKVSGRNEGLREGRKCYGGITMEGGEEV